MFARPIRLSSTHGLRNDYQCDVQSRFLINVRSTETVSSKIASDQNLTQLRLRRETAK